MTEVPNESTVMNSLAVDLSESIKQGSDHLETLETQSRKLLGSKDGEPADETKEELSKETGEVNEAVSGEDDKDSDAELIRELERERLEVVMAIQRQEYTMDKLDEILEQNHMMSETVKQFLDELSKRRQRDMSSMDDRVNGYSTKVVAPKVSILQGNILDTQKEMVKAQKQMEELQSRMKKEEDLLSSNEFNRELNELISKLNNFFK